MTKRTGKGRGTQAGNGAASGALAEALTPLVAGMTATRTHLLEWVHTLGVDVLQAVFTAEALAGPKGKHQPERTHHHWGRTATELSRGERRALPAETRSVMCGFSLGHSRLDILRTVAKDLLDPDLDRARAAADRAAIEPHPAAPLKIEHEHAKWSFAGETIAKRIGFRHCGGHTQRSAIRSRDKTQSCGDEGSHVRPMTSTPARIAMRWALQEGPGDGWNRAEDASSEGFGLGVKACPPLLRSLSLVRPSHAALDETG